MWKKFRLLTNNPRKISGLENYGVKVVERVPLEISPGDSNIHYLQDQTKQARPYAVKSRRQTG